MAPIEHPATGEATSCWYAAIGSESCPDIPEATPGSCREGGVFWLRGRSVALPASGARQDVRSEGLARRGLRVHGPALRRAEPNAARLHTG